MKHAPSSSFYKRKLITFSTLAFLTLLALQAPGQNRERKPLKVPDSITFLSDLAYIDDDNPKHTLDLLLPKKPNSKRLPVVVFIHGGAWRNGNKSGGSRRVSRFVESGSYAGVSINYRLTGESIWPTQIHDCKAAIRWIKANASKYGLNPDLIGVWGTSAGGHLVSLLGTSAGVAELDGALGDYPNLTSRVACVVDGYGPTNFLTMNKTAIPTARMDHDAPDSPESRLIGGPIQENPKRAAAVNPITYVNPGDAPFLILHGTQDPLVAYNQSELLHDALKNSKIPSTFITIEGGGHGKGFGKEVDQSISDFFAHHLLGQTKDWSDLSFPASKP